MYLQLFFLLLYATFNKGCDFSVTVYQRIDYNSMPSHEKHIVIVTASYNNALWWQGNLTSTLCQNYKNFELIITDDCSPDGTGDRIQQYLEQHELPCTVTLVRNHRRVGALQNIYRSIAWCKPDDIVAIVDGDDELAHSSVLTLINQVYANPDVWMTHGRLQLASSGTTWDWQEPIPAEVIAQHAFRSYERIASHLRTFYVWLFRKIQFKDLLYNGSFFPVTQDVAWVLPLIEMAAHHHAYIDAVTYLYNDIHPLMDAKINRSLQLELERYIRAKPAYAPLAHAPAEEN